MADKKRKRRSPYEILQDDIEQMEKDGLFKSPSASFMQKLYARIKTQVETIMHKQEAKQNTLFKQKLRKSFIETKKDLPKKHVGLATFRFSSLKESFERQYRLHSLVGLNLIKTQNNENMQKLQHRFYSWLTLSQTGGDKEKLKQMTKLPNDKHSKFIIRDQSAKLRSSLDNIVASKYDAIAFQWETRNDNRVAGKPGGLYPDAKKSDKSHGDHWARKGKWFYYENSWAVKKGKLNLSKFEGSASSIPDGLPGTPIGCRCYAKNVYELEDLPPELVKDNT